ncbi:MAG: hypothetical protein GY859_06685, partial [Desulfobacterales bacterium]|nr:hypothetical protein [Desulfobacterales bacterium]
RVARDSLEAAGMWRPGAGMIHQCDEVLRLISDLAARFDRKLVVSIIGPCGSGKSTLLNALAGRDGLSETGNRRPTTRGVVILCREREDAAQLVRKLGEEKIRIRSSRAAGSLEHALLIDTPDTDSTEGEDHIPMVHDVIGLSDALICLFDAQNPKRRDQADFLEPYVRRFNGESILVALNKCDRLGEEELKETILPGFSQYIRDAWDGRTPEILCIAGRRHLNDPGWTRDAGPRHDFDQFDALRDAVFNTFNRKGYAVDRRLENARELRDFALGDMGREALRDQEALVAAGERIREAEKEALGKALESLEREGERGASGVNARLYGKLARRWLGPVGWLVAAWARIIGFGSNMADLLRAGGAARRFRGLVSPPGSAAGPGPSAAEAERGERAAAALGAYRIALLRHWPDIAETLVKGRFDESVRHLDRILPDSRDLGKSLAATWEEALAASIDRTAESLSGFFTQAVFNLPVIGVLGYTGWITARQFFSGKYLSTDFFLHAFLTIAIILFLSFFLLQAGVRLIASPARVSARAFETVKRDMINLRPLTMHPVREQIDMVLAMGEGKDSG